MSANGRLTAAELVEVEPSIFLATSSANSYRTMKAAAAAAGLEVHIARPDGGYRDFDTQLDLLNQWLGRPHETEHNLDPGSGARPAEPGTTSPHGYGVAADIWGTGWQWVVTNGGRYGWTRPLANDPHHFVHDGITAAGLKPTPIEEENMAQGAFYRIKKGEKGEGEINWQEKPNTPLIYVDSPTWRAYAANGNRYADCTAAEVAALKAKFGTAAAPLPIVAKVDAGAFVFEGTATPK